MSKNKTIWITGASSGIGEALAKTYNTEGNTLILSGRNELKLQNLKKSLTSPENVKIVAFDVCDFEALTKATTIIKKERNFPDLIILNAGISQRSKAIDTTIEVTEKLMRTNFLSNVHITKNLLPEIITHKTHIAVISSVTGIIGPMLRSSYAASKHALHGYFDSLRAELHDTGVKITLICPGYVHTQISMNALIGNGSTQKSMDVDTKNGLEPMDLAKKIEKAVRKGKSEVYFGGKEILAIYLKRYFPSILERIIRKSNPK